MRLPNREDDMFVRIVQMSCKISAYTTMEKKLYAKVSQSNDADDMVAMALFQCVLIPFLQDGQRQHKCLMDVMEWSSRAINNNEEHWLARMLRAMVRLQMNDDTDEMAIYLMPMDYTTDDVEADLKKMVELQDANNVQTPYGLLPYVLMAYNNLLNNDITGAKEVLEEADNKYNPTRIVYLKQVMKLPFHSLYKKAYAMQDREMVRLLKRWISALFPDTHFKKGAR